MKQQMVQIAIFNALAGRIKTAGGPSDQVIETNVRTRERAGSCTRARFAD